MLQAVQKIILVKQKISTLSLEILTSTSKILMTSLKNILVSFKNLKRVLTGEEKILIPSFKILIVSFGILVSSFLIMNNTYADENSNLNYSVTVEPALNITTSSNKVSLDLNPLNHDFDSQDLTVSVSTNNETGYKLYVNTEKTTNNPNGNKLIEKDDNSLHIETLADEVSENNFTTNRWGYRIGSGNYLPFEPGILLNSSKTQIENNSSTLTFAAKVGYETKAGTYALALNFQATANPHIPYMQNLDPTLCVTDEPTAVIDSRDERQYLVQRLADGKCWMLDNLALNIVNLSVDDMKDKTNATEAELNYLKGVTKGTTSDRYATSGVTISNASSFSVPHINTSLIETMDSSANRWGNGQHKYGILYNYCAASAGTYCYGSDDATTTGSPSGDSVADVCPAGWRMPTGTPSAGEYWTLCSALKGSNCATGVDGTGSVTDMMASNASSLQYQLSTPMSGCFYGDSVRYTGDIGRFWSSSYYAARYMYSLEIYSDKVQTQYNSSRWVGRSIRCVLE